MRIYPECSFEFEEQVTVCPKCGCSLESNGSLNCINKIGSYLLIIAAVFCQIFGIWQNANDDYKFYCEHRSDCLKDYDIIYSAATSDKSENLRNAYFSFAERYEDMIEYDNKEIAKYRISLIISIGCGVTFMLLAVKYIKNQK
ncbi:MAG: hypothetical protein K2K57_08990 [Oscillospiraceae bacterium]|nr:hypothetical protein [Oscillospiraceae bacterium]